MLLIHGRYTFKPKRLAFRNDFCLSCNQPRRTAKIRTFDAFHIFWIPVLPLGFKNRWVCTVCNRQAHVTTKTRRGFKWAGLVVLGFFALFAWATPLTADVAVGIWIVRICAPVGAVVLLVYLLRSQKESSLKEKLAAVAPASDIVCPFCGAQLLILGAHVSCPACGVVRS